jgi:hypothetical protein
MGGRDGGFELNAVAQVCEIQEFRTTTAIENFGF